MALLENIEWIDEGGNEIVHRVPEYGSGETKMGSQLVVRESQVAVFFRDGKGLDEFGPGRHTLSTLNLPILSKLIGMAFDDKKSPFKTEVVFVNQKVFNEMKWGTKEPVAFRDTEFGIVRLRAFGNFTMRVLQPKLFINTIVGTRGTYSSTELGSYLRNVIISRLNDLLGETIKTVLDLPAVYDELGVAVKMRLKDDFLKYGIDLIDFFINAITPPEEVQKAIDKRSSMGALGDMNRYMQYQTAEAMRDAAQNQGGAGGAMSAGLGAGLGMMMPGMISNQMQQAQQGQQNSGQAAPTQTVPCPSCKQPVAAGVKFCNHCGGKMVTAPVCPECKNEVPQGGKFCPHCGGKMAPAGLKKCPKCDNELAEGAKFCMECGEKIA